MRTRTSRDSEAFGRPARDGVASRSFCLRLSPAERAIIEAAAAAQGVRAGELIRCAALTAATGEAALSGRELHALIAARVALGPLLRQLQAEATAPLAELRAQVAGLMAAQERLISRSRTLETAARRRLEAQG